MNWSKMQQFHALDHNTSTGELCSSTVLLCLSIDYEGTHRYSYYCYLPIDLDSFRFSTEFEGKANRKQLLIPVKVLSRSLMEIRQIDGQWYPKHKGILDD